MGTTRSLERAGWLRLIIDHNPFYMLSAISMVLGCHALNSALYTKAGHVGKLLIVLTVINIYEALVVGLGAVLVRRRDLVQRDGRILLGLEALFLADAGFLSGLVSTVSAGWGWGLNIALLALAAIKIYVAARALNTPQIWRLVAVVLAEVAVLLLVPTVFKQLVRPDGKLPELAAYGAWWVAGGLAGLATWLLWPGRFLQAFPREIVVRAALIGVPYASVLVHVYGAAWVYDLDFVAADITPILLGLAIAAGTLLAWGVPRHVVIRSQAVLLIVAVLCSMDYPTRFVFDIGSISVTPFRIALAGVALVSIYAVWLHWGVPFAVVAAACVAVVLLGHNAETAWLNLRRIFESIGRAVKMIVPKTALAWGVTAVIMAFALLGIGAVVSFRRKPSAANGAQQIPEAAEALANSGDQQPAQHDQHM